MSYQELDGKCDSTVFFDWLGEQELLLTTIFIECRKPKKEFLTLFNEFKEEGDYLPGNQTTWPKTSLFRLRYSRKFCKKIGELSLKYAEFEYIEHFFAYEAGNVVLKWYDAFSSPLLVSNRWPENKIEDIGKRLGMSIGRVVTN